MITEEFDSIQRKTEIASSGGDMRFLVMEAPEQNFVASIFSPTYIRTVATDETVPATRDFVGQEKRMLNEMM